MKKLLLFLFPVLLSAQFENQYYVLLNDGFSWTSTIIKYDIETNTILEDFGSEAYYSNGDTMQINERIGISFFPNSHKLLLEFTEYFFRPSNQINQYENDGGDGGHLNSVGSLEDFGDIATFINNTSGGDYENYSDDFGFVGINEENSQYATLMGNYILNACRNVSLNIWSGETLVSLDINDYIKNENTNYNIYHIYPGLAYNKYNHSIYFLGVNDLEEPTFYQVNLNTYEISPLPMNLGSAPCCNYRAMHFLTGQNKIRMVDHLSGNFYTYDLINGNVELFAETDLENVYGIVNVQDFLGNVEVYNQGEISIYPNPVVDYLNIQSSKKIKTLELFNVLGQKISDFKLDQNRINFSTIPAGIYVLKMSMENGKVETKKIIKK